MKFTTGLFLVLKLIAPLFCCTPSFSGIEIFLPFHMDYAMGI
jgi:hypothetical protein